MTLACTMKKKWFVWTVPYMSHDSAKTRSSVVKQLAIQLHKRIGFPTRVQFKSSDSEDQDLHQEMQRECTYALGHSLWAVVFILEHRCMYNLYAFYRRHWAVPFEYFRDRAHVEYLLDSK
jgi:hypothetical protein